MSSGPPDPSAEDWPLLLDALGRLHRQLLTKTEELQTQLEHPAYSWTVGDDVHGYLAPRGLALTAAERSELAAGLRANLWALRQLTARLEQLHALVDDSSASEERPDSP